MERVLATVGLLCGVAALVVALAGRDPPTPRPLETVALEARIAEVELGLADLRQRLDPAPATHEAGPARTSAKVTTREPAEWPVVARKLTIDLRLDTRRADIVDKALEECSEALGGALEHKDALWRDRLSKRARKAAHSKVAAALSEKQLKGFDKWLSRPDYAHLACWFLPERKCGGCGRRKGTKKGTGK